MSTTKVELGFTRFVNDKRGEIFHLEFDLTDETLGTVFDKMEVMLNAMGFVIDGKELRLVDRESESDSLSGSFLTEDFDYNRYADVEYGPGDTVPPFSVIHGKKD